MGSIFRQANEDMLRVQRTLGWFCLFFAPIPVGLILLRSFVPTMGPAITISAILTCTVWGFALMFYGILRLIHEDD